MRRTEGRFLPASRPAHAKPSGAMAGARTRGQEMGPHSVMTSRHSAAAAALGQRVVDVEPCEP
jgi:hypothetical protein